MKIIKNILIAPDKFKFTLTANEVTEAIYSGLSSFKKKLNIYKYPLADGGEGTSDILASYLKADKIGIIVNDPIFRKIKTYYYYSENKKTAIIDLSLASGLQLLKKHEQNPMNTSSYGTGEMVLSAVNKGAKKIFLGLGGSATTDAGIGAANAIGYKFLSKTGKEINPIGKNLINIAKIDDSDVNFQFNNIEIIALFDVNNILYGDSGAAYIYSEQKGANKDELKILDQGLKNIATIIKEKYKKDISKKIGGGSAGGFGAGVYSFMNAKLKSGSKTVFDITGLASVLKKSDLIITGEGKFDSQSFQGKITGELIKKAEKFKIPIAVICGVCDSNIKKTKQNDIVSIYTLFNNNINIEDAKKKSFKNIANITKQIIEELHKKN